MRKSETKAAPSEGLQRRILSLAALAGCHPKTAEKALREGVSSVRGRALQERLTVAMGELK